MTRRFLVEARDGALANLGPISDYSSMSVVPRFNAVGSWQLVYSATSKSADLLAAGGGVRIMRRGSNIPILTGPLTGIVETAQGRSKAPLLTFTGVCDNVHLTNRLAYPVPGAALSAQASAYDVRSGVAETIMRQYVNVNAGPGALTARRTAGLVLAADLTQGATVAASARFDNVLSLLQSLAAAGGVGFQVVQLAPNGSLTFRVYVPHDRSATVKFSTRTGSLGSYTFTVGIGSATAAIVGDQTAGTGRVFAEFIDAAAQADWGQRIETFVSQTSTTDSAQIAQAGAEALDQGAPQVQVAFTPLDRPGRRFGIDYGLGDLVTVETRRGGVIADVVREVNIADDAKGTSTQPLVGASSSANPSTALYLSLRDLFKRVGLLERRH